MNRDGNIIISKTDQACSVCPEVIRKGDRAFWYSVQNRPRSGEMYHLACIPTGVAVSEEDAVFMGSPPAHREVAL